MKKVLIVGANPLLVPLISTLTKHNDVVVCESSNIELPSSVKLHRLKKSFFGFKGIGEVSLPYYQKGLIRILNLEQPDIIIVMDYIRLWYWQVLWYRIWHPAAKIVVYSETQRVPTSVFSKIAFYIFWFTYRISESLVYKYLVYTDLGRKFAESYGVKAPIHVLPVPVDTNYFTPSEVKEYLPDGLLRILMNARYVPYKRHIDLFDAVLILKQSGIKLSLTCVGRGGDLLVVRSEIAKRGLEDTVTLIAEVSRDEVLKLYREHDVLVLPSDGEAIGMVVPEAMACGLPTITSDTVGANVYVREGETGLIFKTRNTKELAEALESLTGVTRLRYLAQTAQKQAEKFSIEFLLKEGRNFLVTF